MVSSNLYSVRHRYPSVHCTRPYFFSSLEYHSSSDRSHNVYDRECSCDRFNPVQNLQGIPGSQDPYSGRPNFRGHWRDQTSACHVHTNWIWRGFVFDIIGSACGHHCNHECCLCCLFDHRWYPWNTQCNCKISHFYVILLISWASLGYHTHHYLGAGVNRIVSQRGDSGDFQGRS